MLKLDASKSGSFRIGGEIEVHRLGFGAMRLTGPGIWRPPAPLREFLTSESISSTPPIPMGPMSPSSSSARHFIPMTEFLSPPRRDCGDPVRVNGNRMAVRNICVKKRSKAAKGSGCSRSDSSSCTASTRECRVTSSSLRSSHCKDEGIIRLAGLSNVSVEDVEAASEVFKVATVQNRYNLIDRGSEDVLDYCLIDEL
jgi:pyridoxine 4-dehydrogenase